MDLNTFYEKFELFADAPDAVAKTRALILELATSGALGLGDKNDESANDLLKRITENFESLIKSKTIRKPKKTEELPELDLLPKLPNNWIWSRLGDIVDYGSAPKVDSKNIDETSWLLDLEDIEKSTSRLILKKAYKEKPSKSTKAQFGKGDVLYGKLRPYLDKVLVADAPGYCTTEIIPIRTYSLIEPGYLRIALKRPSFIEYATAKSYGMNLPRLGTEDARNALFPLPPLAEQKRIVAKVDELMALCDQLEVQQAERAAQTHELNRAALHRFHQAPRPETLGALFHPNCPLNPADLRKSILTLAVQGKLVPQDPEDEPASELLNKIAEKKERLVKEKKIKKQPELPPVEESEFPFSPPPGWQFSRIGNLTSKLGSGSTPRGGKSAYVNDGIIFLRSQNVWNDGLKLEDTAYIPDETHEIMNNTQVLPRDVLLNITGASLGRSTIFPENLTTANVSQHVTIIRLVELEMADFLHLGILSPLVQKLVWGRQVGMAIEGLSKKVLEKFEFPIPPLAEQRRIVAKVDELMALVDQLEAQLEESRSTAQNLLDALVAELTNQKI